MYLKWKGIEIPTHWIHTGRIRVGRLVPSECLGTLARAWQAGKSHRLNVYPGCTGFGDSPEHGMQDMPPGAETRVKPRIKADHKLNDADEGETASCMLAMLSSRESVLSMSASAT